ncbi:MAG: hypothetical protein LBT52_01655, partial [Clostridiales Family XIII bacterium]|nr:hypothetical protein [Clostridiales Family XIII bacterium]
MTISDNAPVTKCCAKAAGDLSPCLADGTNPCDEATGLGEECGVFGIASPPGADVPAAINTFYALFALQHR